MAETNGLAVAEHSAVGLPALTFTRDQIDLVKKTVAKGATDDELALFLYTCKRTGLDPLIKQIYAIKRGNVMGFQTSIDGYRLIAERTGKYAPGRQPEFTEKDGKLVAATAYVKKHVGGEWHEVAATAYFGEYNVPTNQIWTKMPHAMLSKCAESLALRRAFPAEMAGVYTQEEMAQADNDTVTVHAEPAGPAAQKKQVANAGMNQVTFIPVEVKEKSGTNKNGKPYTKWGIVHPDGTTYGTFDRDLGKLAAEACQSRQELTLTYEQDGKFFNAKEALLVENDAQEDAELS